MMLTYRVFKMQQAELILGAENMNIYPQFLGLSTGFLSGTGLTSVTCRCKVSSAHSNYTPQSSFAPPPPPDPAHNSSRAPSATSVPLSEKRQARYLWSSVVQNEDWTNWTITGQPGAPTGSHGNCHRKESWQNDNHPRKSQDKEFLTHEEYFIPDASGNPVGSSVARIMLFLLNNDDWMEKGVCRHNKINCSFCQRGTSDNTYCAYVG
nr:uncharacterized protein LOC111839375 [Paramormyrops kingsleyae]